MLGVEEGYEAVEGVAVGSLGVGLAGAGAVGEGVSMGCNQVSRRAGDSRYDDVVRHVAEIQPRLGVLSSWAGDYLAQKGSHFSGTCADVESVSAALESLV